MVFMKWLGIVIVVLVVIVLAIKICTKNKDSDDDEFESRMERVKRLLIDCCTKKKGRHRI